jgi:hypothetical protein
LECNALAVLDCRLLQCRVADGNSSNALKMMDEIFQDGVLVGADSGIMRRPILPVRRQNEHPDQFLRWMLAPTRLALLLLILHVTCVKSLCICNA